jgi:hypothetical protein
MLCRPKGHNADGSVRSIEKIHLIGTRTRDLPACSIVHQPTTLPRISIECIHMYTYCGVFTPCVTMYSNDILTNIYIHMAALWTEEDCNGNRITTLRSPSTVRPYSGRTRPYKTFHSHTDRVTQVQKFVTMVHQYKYYVSGHYPSSCFI